MSKAEPLFPPSASCPDCGKKIRIKWAAPREVVSGLSGLGHMKCLHCGANHVRAVGPVEAIQETSRMFAAQYHDACGHDHGHDHDHDHMHGVAVIPGGDKFAYIKLPG
jgi:DNA-directed RNA polymerase subunit RPC12/RpoP